MHLATLNDYLRIESQPYEATSRENTDQWVSSFYRGTVHYMAPRTCMEVCPLLGATILIDTRTDCRGVDHASLSTPEIAWAHIAAFPHYGDAISVAQWRGQVEPFLHRALDQLPLSSYLANPEAKPLRAVPIAHPGEMLTHHALPLSSFALVEKSHTSSERTTLLTTVDPRLFSLREKSPQRLITALDALVSSGKLKGYTWLREKPLVQCEPCLQLALALPVPAVLDAGMFPSPPAVAV